MKKKTKKLVLAKESVRSLEAKELTQAGGGGQGVPIETLMPSLCNCDP